VAVACARDRCEAEVIDDLLRQCGIATLFRRIGIADVPEPFGGEPWVVLAATEWADEANALLDALDLGGDPPEAQRSVP
jgi:hypothetical protein